MLQALRPEDSLAIAEVSRRRSRDEQAMAQYLGIGRGARATGTPLDGTLLRRPDDVDLAAFESEERRRLDAAIAQLSPDARRELIALIWLVQMVYRGGCGSRLDDECASPSVTMIGSRSARPRASRKERSDGAFRRS